MPSTSFQEVSDSNHDPESKYSYPKWMSISLSPSMKTSGDFHEAGVIQLFLNNIQSFIHKSPYHSVSLRALVNEPSSNVVSIYISCGPEGTGSNSDWGKTFSLVQKSLEHFRGPPSLLLTEYEFPLQRIM